MLAKILPVTTIDPLTNTEPDTSRVSALLENNILPVSPVALNAPDTTSDPDIVTA